MPCFKGLAVSIHTPDGPIAEHSVQKQSRQSRISTYIPVPPAKIPANSTTGKPEQSTFAISITLLTPGLNVPYSTPKATSEDPHPKPRVVGGLPGYGNERGKYSSSIPPYVPRTTNPNETIAAYIYFDGRAKEEVATLLRRGEETWVNSRWVSIPESEGGGLAEREFLFREVGLERWLNGLDLQGSNKEKAERIERRQRRLDKKRRKRKEQHGEMDSDDEGEDNKDKMKRTDRNGVLRYGGEDGSPVEELPNDEGLFSSNSDSEDEAPQPEAAGQIKVALFRVLASGEIKRGEYSPQFDAHDDDEGMDNGHGDAGDGDVDHTTSFAKPKSLDPKSISTQTVTGLDPPESPYAVFTFFYRGEKQLQKMGILSQPESKKDATSSRRKSSATDFSKLGPLKSAGTVGYSGYRDPANAKRKSNNRDVDAMDSDADDEDDNQIPEEKDDVDAAQDGNGMLSAEDAKQTGEISEGVQKIKLKRQHSADQLGETAAARKSPHIKADETSPVGTPLSVNSTAANAGTPPDSMSPAAVQTDAGEVVGSPFKRHRASIAGLNSTTASAFNNSAGVSNEGLLPSTSFNNVQPEEPTRAASMPEVKTEISKAADSDEEL